MADVPEQVKDYLRAHRLPALLETVLQQLVSSFHPYPYEWISQMAVLNQPLTLAEMKARAAGILMQASRLRENGELLGLGEALSTVTFDVFRFSPTGDEVLLLVWIMFSHHGVLGRFDVPPEVFLVWTQVVQANYHNDLPFHNFGHAVGVVHMLHVFLCAAKGTAFREAVRDLDLFAMLVAGLCCDLQHPGLCNDTLVESLHPLALRYNDVSVLEQVRRLKRCSSAR
jgi:hypothetical protein